MTIKGSLEGKLEREIKKMEFGEVAYTLPWALRFEPSGDKLDAYLDVKAPVAESPFETLRLKVTRIGHEKGDFEVDLNSVDNYLWSIRRATTAEQRGDDCVHIGKIDYF